MNELLNAKHHLLIAARGAIAALTQNACHEADVAAARYWLASALDATSNIEACNDYEAAWKAADDRKAQSCAR